MKRPTKVLVFTAFALPAIALAALWMCFDDEPLVVHRSDLSTASYEKAQQFVETHVPRNGVAAGVRTIVASQEEVNLVMNHVARLFGQAATRVTLRPGAALVQAS